MTTPPLYKNLNSNNLGIVARQSELNELALTHGFKGLDIDLTELAERAEKVGLKEATQFVFLPVGQFPLPLSLEGEDNAFNAALEKLKPLLEVAQKVKAFRWVYTIRPTSDDLPYHENFERHRARVTELSKLLGEYGVKLGLGISGAAAERGDGQFQFIQQAEDLLTFIKTVDLENVGLWLDCWNWKLAGGDTEAIKELGPRKIVAVTVADISPEADLDAITSDDRLLPQAEGLVDLKGIFAALVEIAYDGPVTLTPAASRIEGARDAVVQSASKTLDVLWNPELAVEEAPADESAEGSEASGTEENAEASDADKADTEKADAEKADADNTTKTDTDAVASGS